MAMTGVGALMEQGEYQKAAYKLLDETQAGNARRIEAEKAVDELEEALFSFAEVMEEENLQAALKRFVAFKRKARKTIKAVRAIQP